MGVQSLWCALQGTSVVEWWWTDAAVVCEWSGQVCLWVSNQGGNGGGGGWSPRYLMSFSFLSRCRNLMGSKGGCFLCKRLMSLQVCVCFEYVRFNRRSRYSSLYLRTNAVSPSVSPYLVQNPIPSGWETPRSQTRAQEMQIKSKRKEAK